MKLEAKMKVTLLSYTPEAMDLLIFTKNTRLSLVPGFMDEIKAWPLERKLAELEYMANTIPSSWEMVDYVFLMEGVSRAYTHQQVRTRAASYAQQTMRVLDMGEFDYIYPTKISSNYAAKEAVDIVLETIKTAYNFLIARGIQAEDARGILPTNISTNIVCKFNLRTMAELARSRTGGRTQGEYQKVINGAIDCVLAIHPWAEKFLFQQQRDYFAEIEKFALEQFPDLLERGKLLKIVDKMRKEKL
jgi:flavin-dependent thymidylate synthase